MDIDLRADGDLVVLSVRAQPRASKSAVAGLEPSGAIKIKLAAPPVDGQANEELLRFLGREVLAIAPSQLSLRRGETGKSKSVAISGLSIEAVRARLEAAIATAGRRTRR